MDNKATLRPKTIQLSLVFFLLAFLITVMYTKISIGQEIKDVDPEMQGSQQNIASVKVDGHLLFYIRGISSFSAQDRSERITKRIIIAASNPAILSDSVKIIPGKDREQIYAGEEFIMNVFDIDGQAEGVSRGMLADLIQKKIRTAIDLHRYERSRPVLVKKSLYAAGAAVLLTVIMFILFWLIRRLNAGLQKRIEAKIGSVENLSYNLIRSSQLWTAINVLFKTLKIVVIIIIVAVFFQYILGLFPWTNAVAKYTLNLFIDPVIKIGKGFLDFLPSLAFLIVIFLVFRYLLRLIKMLFTGIEQGGIVIKSFDPDWAFRHLEF